VADESTTSPPRRRRRLGLSLRVLMILVLFFGGGLGWLAYRARVQREAVAAIEKAGGKVYYDWQYFAGGTSPPPPPPPGPKWLVDFFGIDYFRNVTMVQIDEGAPGGVNSFLAVYTTEFSDGRDHVADDALMGQIARLERLERLDLIVCLRLTDAGIAKLRGLRHLDSLSLLCCRSITDASLPHLDGMSRDMQLILTGTAISKGGISSMQEAFPSRHVTK
jgi:hypothetical protein